MDRPILNEKEKLAQHIAGETTIRILAMDGTSAEDVIRDRNRKKFNDKVDEYVERFEKHSTNLQEYAEKVNQNVENVEIMPIGNYVICKQFDINPFQRMVKDSKSGLILDAGGFAPTHNNTDSGKEDEEDDLFILTGVIQEVGPECKWTKPGDAIFFTKPSMVPIPFYKQQLVLVNETRILAVVNEGLTERFNNINK